MTNITSQISEFEIFLNNIKSGEYDKNSIPTGKILGLVCSISGLEPGSIKKQKINPVALIFNQSNSEQEKKSAATCLLRIICSNDSIIYNDTDLRIKTFALFDETISYLYSRIKINKSDETHVKLSKIKDLEEKIFETFDDITQSIRNISKPISLREKYIAEINNPLTNLFLRPFIDAKIINKERLNDIFSVTEMYFNAPTDDKLEFYNKASEIYENYLNDLKNEPSIFAQKCLLDPINILYSRIKSDFDTIGIIKPTNLSIIDTQRKYALHEIDKTLEVKYIVFNEGPGHAFDVEIEIEYMEGIEILNKIINLGNLPPGKIEIIFDSKVIKNTMNRYIIGQLYWRNYKEKEIIQKEFIFELIPQRANINWDKIKFDKPYSLEAVETEDELIGREEVIGNIYSKLTSKVIESSIIYGQKRVGKTSIAKILKTKLQKDNSYVVIFIAVGDLDKTTTLKFVTNLGKEIFLEIKDEIFGKIAKDIENPMFDGALSPLVRYFKEIKRIDSSLKFIIIIDEFDEIPSELKYYTSVGDSFFHNIRSISSESQIGFVLVGAENMQLIKQSTDRLNKFDSFRVDYFDKSKHWRDFCNLVSRPTDNCLEYSDDAINILYEITEGNPFFTKLVCANIFAMACDSHNSFISIDEVQGAIRETISSLDTNQFNHFWKDGINEDDPARIDLIETQRRKFLIAYAEAKCIFTNVKSSDLSKSEFSKTIAIQEILESFVNRDILVKEGEYIRLRPRIFEAWMIERGSKIMTSTLLDERTYEFMRNKEADAYVKDQEIADLVEHWSSYRGSEITTAQVRRWLCQFGDNISSRIMFNLLKHIKFYGEYLVREKLKMIHKKLRSQIIYEIKNGERSRRDIILSSFGVPSKSGSTYTRLYAQENKIHTNNIVSFDNIHSKILNNDAIKAIVFVEDIIASGESACEMLEQLEQKYGDFLKTKEIKTYIGAICGFKKGLDNVYKKINTLKFEVQIEIIDELTEEDQCLSESSLVFKTPDERHKAEEIIKKYGMKLQKKQPFGYGDCQLLVIFHDNCPNNTLPIIWGSSAGEFVWNPLFRRG